MIKAQKLTKSFRNRFKQIPAVSGLSFQVQPGKVTGFLGPNGSGKSTTMRLMLGLDLGGGTTTYDGKMLTAYKQPSRVVGSLLEAKAFHPTRSARNHLKVLADAGGINHNRIDEVIDLVGLHDAAKKSPGKFSLGMAQRLSLAAALLGKPKYLLLDEPANGLDPEGIAWLRQFIRDYAKDGNGVMVSSHLLSEMSLMADDVVVIGKGKLITDTSVRELLKNNKGASVFVRAAKLAKLEAQLKKAKLSYKRLGSGLEVSGATTDRVGKLAAQAGVPLLELSSRQPSLESAFLELTEDAQEFRAIVSEEKAK